MTAQDVARLCPIRRRPYRQATRLQQGLSDDTGVHILMAINTMSFMTFLRLGAVASVRTRR